MVTSRRTLAAPACAAIALIGAVITYVVVLAPITDVFDVPIHKQPLTAFGKSVMARVGPLQAFALLAGILFLLALAASRGRMRSLRLAAIAALGVATAILGLEALMILGWLVTLWPSTDATAADLGASRQLSLWPVGWHAQIVVGFMLLIVELLVAAAALERWTRRHRTEIPALELSRE